MAVAAATIQSFENLIPAETRALRIPRARFPSYTTAARTRKISAIS
jgi:hypothetical protein